MATTRTLLIDRTATRLAAAIDKTAEHFGWEQTAGPDGYDDNAIFDYAEQVAHRVTGSRNYLEGLSQRALRQFAKEVRQQAAAVIASIRRHRARKASGN